MLITNLQNKLIISIKKEMMKPLKKAEWILRIGIAGEFLGHGVFALMIKKSWIPYFVSVGIPESSATILLPMIGLMDITIAFIVLINPLRAVLAFAAFWGFLTALIRPVSGESIWDFIERFANWAAPLALLYIREIKKDKK